MKEQIEIKAKVITSTPEKSQNDFYLEIDEAEDDGWIVALSKHRKGLSFCILYKEGK